MRHSASSILSVTLALALAYTPRAQLGQPHGVRFDAQQVARLATGVDYAQMQGVARDAAGNYFVAATRATATGKHRLLKFDSNGAYLAGYDQPRRRRIRPRGCSTSRTTRPPTSSTVVPRSRARGRSSSRSTWRQRPSPRPRTWACRRSWA